MYEKMVRYISRAVTCGCCMCGEGVVLQRLIQHNVLRLCPKALEQKQPVLLFILRKGELNVRCYAHKTTDILIHILFRWGGKISLSLPLVFLFYHCVLPLWGAACVLFKSYSSYTSIIPTNCAMLVIFQFSAGERNYLLIIMPHTLN